MTLTAYVTVKMPGGASAICCSGPVVWLLSDRAAYLYQCVGNTVVKMPLFAHPEERLPKSVKPDFESMALYGGQLYLFPSGSGKNRNTQIIFDPATTLLTRVDLLPFFNTLRQVSGMAESEFNIEGVILQPDRQLFFQRGNGPQKHNGIFLCEAGKTVRYVPVPLPDVEGVPATFTDALLHQGRIYFLAAAENSASTYWDGEVTGTLLGIMDPETFEVLHTTTLPGQHKFEGISFFEESPETLTFLLCEDQDEAAEESTIYRLDLKKQGSAIAGL